MSGEFVFVDPDFDLTDEKPQAAAIAAPMPATHAVEWKPWAVVLGLAAIWMLVWSQLRPFADWFSYQLKQIFSRFIASSCCSR